MTSVTATFMFDLGRAPVTRPEEETLRAATAREGLDARYWAAMNGLVSTSSRSDTPLVLRAFRGGQLAGIAHVLECRRTNRCLFPRLGRALDAVPTPTYYWTRGDAAVDLLGSPGIVADAEDAETFYRDAIAFLNTRYVSGIVLEQPSRRRAAACYETVMMDWGRYRVVPEGTDALLRQHKNLRRKTSAFRNKGGAIEIVHGALGPADCGRVLHCLAQSATNGALRAPFQENYPNMVHWASASGADGIVHIVARLDDVLVGYHSYLHSGMRLLCLSGGFDRTRHSTYHAYENILLDTMRFAEANGVGEVSFGPVGNPTKAALMPESVPFVARFYSRFAALRQAMSLLVPRSALRAAAFADRASARGRDEARDVSRPPAVPLGA
jgi:hypothetical protein